MQGVHLRQEVGLAQQRWILLGQLTLQLGQLGGCFAHDEAEEVAREWQAQGDAVDERQPTHATHRLVTAERARVDLSGAWCVVRGAWCVVRGER